MPNEVNETTRPEVIRAVDGIVEAFATTDTSTYFAAFSLDAPFVFRHLGEGELIAIHEHLPTVPESTVAEVVAQ